MKIPDKILKLWTKKHSRGDVSKLIQYTNASKPTIIKAIRHGYANEEIILKISQYYSEKKATDKKAIVIQALKLFINATTQNN